MRARTVVALAGRRIDASNSGSPRFPISRLAVVEQRIRRMFIGNNVGVLVCSAANGADLTALHVAHSLGIRCRIVLPFAVSRFRTHSVIDREGGELWGWMFDHYVQVARESDDLIVLRGAGQSSRSFRAATLRIIREASELAQRRRTSTPLLFGMAIWDRKRIQPHDMTATFVEESTLRGISICHVGILR